MNRCRDRGQRGALGFDALYPRVGVLRVHAISPAAGSAIPPSSAPSSIIKLRNRAPSDGARPLTPPMDSIGRRRALLAVRVMDTRERARVGSTAASGRGDERDVAAVPAMTETASAESMYSDVRPRERLGGQLRAALVKEFVHIDPSSSNVMWADPSSVRGRVVSRRRRLRRRRRRGGTIRGTRATPHFRRRCRARARRGWRR